MATPEGGELAQPFCIPVPKPKLAVPGLQGCIQVTAPNGKNGTNRIRSCGGCFDVLESNVWRNFSVVFAELVADNRSVQAYETGVCDHFNEPIGSAFAPRTAGPKLAAKATVANRFDTLASVSTPKGVMP